MKFDYSTRASRMGRKVAEAPIRVYAAAVILIVFILSMIFGLWGPILG